MERDDDQARVRPADAVDALEGDAPDTEAAPDGDDDSPAFELDLDPEQQGTADAAAANPD